jgi:hypothetical protein
MPEYRWVIPIIIGAVFILLGIGAVLWGRKEEKSYYNSLTSRRDLREFVNHWPTRPEPGASKIGGWIALAVGLILIVVGVILWLVG